MGKKARTQAKPCTVASRETVDCLWFNRAGGESRDRVARREIERTGKKDRRKRQRRKAMFNQASLQEGREKVGISSRGKKKSAGTKQHEKEKNKDEQRQYNRKSGGDKAKKKNTVEKGERNLKDHRSHGPEHRGHQRKFQKKKPGALKEG